jgi:hypothetical protein
MEVIKMGDIIKLIKELLVASILIGLFSAMIQANFAGIVKSNTTGYYMIGAGTSGTDLVITYPVYLAYSNLGYLVAVGLFLAVLAVALKSFK